MNDGTERAPAISADNDRDAWLRWRKGGIGGSDAAALLGHGARRKDGVQITPLHVYADKVREAIDDDDSLVLMRGRALEPLAADRYEQETDRRLRRQPAKIHRDYDCVRCSIDRQIIADDSTGGKTGLLEIKTANQQVFRMIRLNGLPMTYWIQIQHNLEVWNYDRGAVAVLQPDSWQFVHFDIERDPEFCRRMVELEVAFWTNHVVPRIPPAATIPQSSEKMPTVGSGELVRSDDMPAALAMRFADLADNLRIARAILAEAEAFHDQAKDGMRRFMEANAWDVIEGDGLRIYNKEQNGRKSLDKLALVADHPQIRLTDYEKTGAPFRTFRVFEV